MIFTWLTVIAVSVLSVAHGQRRSIFDEDLYQEVLDPERCQEQLHKMRAFEFFDASFRIPQGVLMGNLVNLGNYDQCLGINQEGVTGRIEGKYCMIGLTDRETINIPMLTDNLHDPVWKEVNVSEIKYELKNHERISRKLDKLFKRESLGMWNNGRMFEAVPISLAVCIPKACSVAEFLNPITNNSLVPFRFTEQFCRLPDDKPLTAADYVSIVLFSIIGLLTILSTGYDLHYHFILKKDPKQAHKLYSCCSVYTNMNRLLTFSDQPGSIDCLDGIRSLSILWIILGHVYSNYLILYAVNLIDFFEWYSKRRAIWLLSADVSVDTFFTISGLLLVYTAAQKMTARKLLKSLHWFYLNRLLRMFPLLACVVLLQASLFFRVTDGPNWWLLAPHVQNCREYWWSTLLHVQNWVNPLNLCVPQTWYVSVDIQLHILSPLVLCWVLRSRWSAWSAFTIALVAALTANTVFCFFSDFSDGEHFFKFYYYNTLIRAPPFIIGMLFGYFLNTVRESKVYMPKGLVTIGYLLALLGSSYAMYQAYPDWESDIIEHLNYSFEKSLWALSICWMIFACVSGYGGPINWFLSLKMWKFVARISYAMYIFHFSIMFMHAGSMTLPFYYSMENIWFTFAGVTSYTVVVSVAACVLIDAPCSTLQKMMMTGLSKPRGPRGAKTETNVDENEKEDSRRISRNLDEIRD